MTVKAIIDSATHFFAASSTGYTDTDISQIAQAARVSKPTVYYHFAAKPELFSCVLSNTIATVAPCPTPPAGTSSGDLVQVLRTIRTAWNRAPALLTLACQSPSILGTTMTREICYRTYRPTLQPFFDSPRHHLDRSTPRVIGSLVLQVALSEAVDRSGPGHVHGAERALAAMIEGLLNASAQAPGPVHDPARREESPAFRPGRTSTDALCCRQCRVGMSERAGR